MVFGAAGVSLQVAVYLWQLVLVGTVSLRRFQLTNEFLRPYPALTPAVFLIGGVLAVLGPAMNLWGWSWSLALWGLAAGLATIVFRQQAGIACCGFGLGLLLAATSVWAPWQTYRRALPGVESHAEVEAVVVDSRFVSSPELRWLCPDRNIALQIRQIRLHPAARWQRCRGKVVLYKTDQVLHYGQNLRFDAAFVRPWDSGIPHQFQFRRYLQIRGVHHVVQAEDLTVTGDVDGWRRVPAICLRARDWLLRCLLRDVPGAESQRLLAAMTLGLRGGLSAADRRRFLRSGELHLFAISGLHVGIGFSIILLILTVTGVPCRRRFLLAPLFLLAYVLAAGAQPSAVRAWLMLSTWSMGKGLQLPVKPVNTVLASAMILLVLNPLQILHVGFQYSFILVLCLLLGWRWGRQITEYLLERRQWVPLRARSGSWRWRMAEAFLRASTAMLVFGLGAFGLTLWYNQIVLPFSIVTNLGAGLLAWLILLVSCFKVLAGMLGEVLGVGLPSVLAGHLLAGLIAPLRGWAEFCSTPAFVISVSRPAGLMIVVYYACLGLLVLSPVQLPAVAARATLLLLAAVSSLQVIPRQSQCRVDVLVPAGTITPLVCIRRRGESPMLVNTGNSYFGSRLDSWLVGEGVDRLGLVALSSRRRDASGGIAKLAKRYPIDTIAVLQPTPGMRRRLGPAVASGCRTRYAVDGHLPTPTGRLAETEGGWRWTMQTRAGPVSIEWEWRRFESSTITVRDDLTGRIVWQKCFSFADRDRHWVWRRKRTEPGKVDIAGLRE